MPSRRRSCGRSTARSPCASPTSRTRCAARSCSSATCRASWSRSTCRCPRSPRACTRAMRSSLHGAAFSPASRSATACRVRCAFAIATKPARSPRWSFSTGARTLAMPIKRWILHRMNRMKGPLGRSDLPRRSARAGAKPRDDGALREPSLRGLPEVHDAPSPGPQHLGAYAPLIAAIRDELEQFVSSQLRLHLAIAERDRYLLTSIEVDCAEGSDRTDLLSRFTREFTPEQIKRFLARDVIGHLPNAGSIDLSQFAGLNVARAAGAATDDDGYADLRAQLRAIAQHQVPHAFEVALVGRWTETDAGGAALGAELASPATPLAGRRLDIEIEDADGARHITLASVIPNRRYAIGTGEGCDVAVNGTYASRRHCEIWLENGRWWAADAGSTNGIRVEAAQRVLGRAGGKRGETAIEVVAGARIVLSAHAKGKPADYPHVSLERGDASA